MLFEHKNNIIFSFLTDLVDLKYVMWQAVFEISRFPHSSTYDLALDARNSCLKVLQISLLSEHTFLERDFVTVHIQHAKTQILKNCVSI